MEKSAFRSVSFEVEIPSIPGSWRDYTVISQRRDYIANRLNMIYEVIKKFIFQTIFL